MQLALPSVLARAAEQRRSLARAARGLALLLEAVEVLPWALVRPLEQQPSWRGARAPQLARE